MKQILFMCATLALGLFGGLIHPFYALLPYYIFSILQPQALWNWALPEGTRWSFGAALLVLVALALSGRKIVPNIRLMPALIVLAVYALWITQSWLLAFAPGVAEQWFTYHAKILLMATIAIFCIDDLRKLRYVTWTIYACLAYLAWHFNSLYLFEGRMDLAFYGLGVVDNNGAALILAMGLPLAIVFAVSSRSLFSMCFHGLVCMLLVHAVLLSFSRAAMLGSTLGFLWIILHHRPRWQSLGVLAAAALVVSVLAGAEVRQRFESIYDGKPDKSIESRYTSWNAASTLVAEHPLLGMGLRNSTLYQGNAGGADLGRAIHNLYLQTAADSGLPALLAYLTLVAMVLWNFRVARVTLEDLWTHRPPPAFPTSLLPRIKERDLSAVELQARCDQETARYMTALQAALVIFLVNSFFLSSEVMELPWLMIAMGIAVPDLAHAHATGVRRSRKKARSAGQAHPSTPPTQTPTPGMPTGRIIPI